MPKTTTPIAINKAIEDVLRRDRGRLIAGLVSRLGDLQLAEDALQEALISAMSHWGRAGLPNSPIGWLMKVALNKGIDRVRSGQRDANKADQFMTLHPCHPVLDEKSRVALTLRTVCHLTTQEVAAAFLDKDVTMGQRISRAKEKLREARVTFEIPEQEVWPARLDSVLSTIYLIFTAGYVNEDSSDRDLCAEAIFLLRLLDRLSGDDPEIEGALALVLLTEARRKARVGKDGATVPPESQNRALWDARALQEGRELLSQAVQRGRPGPFQIKAAIADCHMADPKPDWRQISLLYGSLWGHEPTPVVALNWAVVIAEVGHLELALRKIEDLEPDLGQFQPFHAAYASILAKVGRSDEARDAYDKAIDLAQNEASRAFLLNKRQLLGDV